MEETPPLFNLSNEDYRLEFSFEYDDLKPPQPKVIGRSLNPRQCRFCRMVEDGKKVTFAKVAHVIPQGFGNRYLTTTEQCDSCNSRGGKLEQEFIRGFEPLRAMAVSRTGTRSFAEFRTKNGSSITSGVNLEQRTVEIVPGDPDLEILEVEGQAVGVTVKQTKVKFLKIAQALGWMAWHLVPESKLDYLEHFRLWLHGRLSILDHSYLYIQPILRAHVPTGIFLFRRREQNHALAPLIVSFRFEALLFSLPIPDRTFAVKEPQIYVQSQTGTEPNIYRVQFNTRTTHGLESDLVMRMGLGPLT